MSVSLRKIDENNWRECIALKVKGVQARFVASNVNGLALAYAHKEMEPRGIYNEDTMVGFIMYARDPDDGVYYINRLMIDEKFQGNGFGYQALKILIEQLKDSGIETLDILHKPDNYNAIKIYRSLGFEQTAEKVDDDVVSQVVLNE